MQSSVAIIPARGGSKRIPRKNIRSFAGRPAMAYAIEAALGSGSFQEVMVSTDCEEIAEVARQAGAKVPFFRSESAGDDEATTFDVLEEVLAAYRQRGRIFETGCCIYPVAPFLRGERVRQAMEILQEDAAANGVITVLRFGHPVQRALAIRSHFLEMVNPQYVFSRSQDLEPCYHDAGQLYAFRISALLHHRTLFVPQARALVLQDEEAHDIDTPEDWATAELKYEILEKRRAAAAQ